MCFLYLKNSVPLIASTQSFFSYSFTLVDSRISVLDFCYFIPFVCIKQSEVNLFMIIRHRPMQMSNNVYITHMIIIMIFFGCIMFINDYCLFHM